MNNLTLIEALIFVSGKEGISKDEIIERISIDEEQFFESIEVLSQQYLEDNNRSIFIKKFGNKYKFVTKPEISNILFDDIEIKKRNPLNQTLMETLAIIAYNSPCTRSKIHDIRKIDPTNQIEKLIELELIKELGRSDSRGNPFIYDVTDKFYDMFGISSLEELPKIKELKKEDLEEVDFFDSNRDE